MSATFVIWASRPERGGLTLGEKVVWFHSWAMDQDGPDACYISAHSMAGRLGLTVRTVEQLRYRLRQLGLLLSFKRAEGINPGWIARLPSSCQPSSGRAAGKEATALAEQLDRFLIERDPDRATPVAEKAMDVARSDTTTGSDSSIPGREVGGRGPPSEVQSKAQLPPAVTQTEDGVVAEATGKRVETSGASNIQSREEFETRRAKMRSGLRSLKETV